MTSPLLQSTVDLSTGGVTPQQTALAILLLALFGLALVIGSYLLQFVNLPEDQTREKKTLMGQREARSGATLRVRPDDDLVTVREQVRALFDGTQPDVEEVSLQTALGVVKQELGSAWGRYAETIPRLARWLFELAVGLSVTAAIVHVSVATYRRLFATGGGQLTVAGLLADAKWAIDQFVTHAVDALGLFPFADVLWALTFAYSVQLAMWLYDNPILLIVVLVLAGVGVVYLDRRAPEAREIRVTTRFSVWSVLLAGVIVWTAGAVPAAIGGVLGFEQIGALLGLLSAVFAISGLSYLFGRAILSDTRALIRVANDPDREAVAYLFVRRLGASAASLAAPLIFAYLVAAVVNGHVTGIIGAFLAGSLAVQAAAVGVGLAVLGAVAWLARDSFADLRLALSNLSADTAVRVAIFRRGVPLVVMVTVYLLALGFELPWVVGIAAAVAAGVGARGAYAIFRRVRYRAVRMDAADRTPRQVQIRAYQLETADGDARYYADVNAVALAHDDPDALTDAVCAVIEDLFSEGETDPSVEQAFAEDLFRYGIVDVDESVTKLEQLAREEAEGRMRKKRGQYDYESLRERVLRQVPEAIWDRVEREKRIRGEWTKRDGRLVLQR